jgi:hypothetical protein
MAPYTREELDALAFLDPEIDAVRMATCLLPFQEFDGRVVAAVSIFN